MEAKILIVEDESIIAEELRRLLLKLGYQVEGVAHRFEEALELLKEKKIDLVLLDIGLNYSTNDGIELASHINELYKIPFLYITGNADIATINRAKATEPASYILKPFNEGMIYSNIEIALHKFKNVQENNFISIRHGSKNIVLDFQNVAYLKADNMYTEFYTADKKVYIARGFLKSFLDKLPCDAFLQIHRSYIINISFVESYTGENVNVLGTQIPIGNLYRKLFYTTVGNQIF